MANNGVPATGQGEKNLWKVVAKEQQDKALNTPFVAQTVPVAGGTEGPSFFDRIKFGLGKAAGATPAGRAITFAGQKVLEGFDKAEAIGGAVLTSGPRAPWNISPLEGRWDIGADAHATDVDPKTLAAMRIANDRLFSGDWSVKEWATEMIELQRSRPILEQLRSEALFALIPFEKLATAVKGGKLKTLMAIGEDVKQTKAVQDTATPPRLLTPDELPPGGGVQGAGQPLPSGQTVGGPRANEPLHQKSATENWDEIVTYDTGDPDWEKKYKEPLEFIMKHVIDRNHPLKKLEAATGIEIHKTAQLVPGSTGKAQHIVEAEYAPLIANVADNIEDLEQFLVFNRIDEITSINPSAKMPAKTSKAAANDALKEMRERLGETTYKKIEEAARGLWELENDIIRQYEKAGMITSVAAQQIIANNRRYVPFFRKMDEGFDPHTFMEGGGPANLSSTELKELHGSYRKIKAPLDNLMQSQFKAQRNIARNKSAQTLVESLIEYGKITGDPNMVRNVLKRGSKTEAEYIRIGDPDASKMGTITYFENGQKVIADIPAEYATVAKALDDINLGVTVKSILRTMSNPLRYGAINYNPFYVPIAVTRDAFQAMSRENVYDPRDWFRAMHQVWTRGEAYGDTARIGGLMSGLIENTKWSKVAPRPRIGSMTVDSAETAMGSLMNMISATMRSKPVSLATLPFRTVERIGVFFERVPRVATNIKLMREGVPELERAVRIRDVTVDFSKGGTTLKAINDAIPFTNAAMQGGTNIMRTIIANPKRSAAYFALFNTPTQLSYQNNKRFETHDMIPEYEFTKHWVFQTGEGEREDGTKFPIYVKIPKGEVAAVLTYPQELIHLSNREHDDRSGDELMWRAVMESVGLLAPVPSSPAGAIPPAAGVIGQAVFNRNAFLQRDIVPGWEEGKSKEYQFNEETKELAIRIGRKVNMSPYVVDFILNNIFASVGQTGNYMVSMMIEAFLGHTPRLGEAVSEDADMTLVEKLSRLPGIKRILGTRNSGIDSLYYDRIQESFVQGYNELQEMPLMTVANFEMPRVSRSLSIEDEEGSTELSGEERFVYQEEMNKHILQGMKVALQSVGSPTEWKDWMHEDLEDAFKDARSAANAAAKERIIEMRASGTSGRRTGGGDEATLWLD